MRHPHLRRACAVALAAAALPCAGALGGSSDPGTTNAEAADATYARHWLGARDLRLGDRGADVKTLNWALRAQGLGTPVHGSFDSPTDSAVRGLEREAGIPPDGVADRWTRKALAVRMPNQRATWYGPGFYGNRTACGQKLTKRTIGVAHRKLPCGTRVAIAYKGRWLRAKVIDRGPYRKGYRWDLTRKLAKQLGALRAGTVTVKTGVAP